MQTPPLAMLSGQKSAPESIQATVFVCTLLCRQRSSQSAPTFCSGLHETLAGAQPFSFLDALGASTAAGTGVTAADLLALWQVTRFRYQPVTRLAYKPLIQNGLT